MARKPTPTEILADSAADLGGAPQTQAPAFLDEPQDLTDINVTDERTSEIMSNGNVIMKGSRTDNGYVHYPIGEGEDRRPVVDEAQKIRVDLEMEAGRLALEKMQQHLLRVRAAHTAEDARRKPDAEE